MNSATPRMIAWITLSLLGFVAVYILSVYWKDPEVERSNIQLLQKTVLRLEAAHQNNMAQGKGAEWFNLYAYLLYHTQYARMGPEPLHKVIQLPRHYPCGCDAVDHGWVLFKDGVIVTGLTEFWDRPAQDLMVPLCIDVNGTLGPNKPGVDIFLGRLYNTLPTHKAYFDWKTTSFGCPGIKYVSVDKGLEAIKQ